MRINLDLIFILLLKIEIFINCRKMKSLLFLPFFLFLVNTLVMMEYIFLRMVMIVWYMLETLWIQTLWGNCLVLLQLTKSLLW